ncbi:hypothetical protein [Aurantimonas sp. VKM B-3413]|uniref:hypothetical protein n=1 Tax=Aurantimonas sp. VKM B-3413 TaxID=2779401 RepID=UPI001E627681|nr:hypothetical protein [Aurantimonas sp. VKM B-3413]MCB8839707.1 hypothetical protein [Aurantimonas sp. VKM B-3413]
MKILPLLSLLALVPALSAGPAVGATDYFSRYDGAWSGGGSVKVEQLPSATSVSCKVDGNRTGGRSFALSGRCRAMLLMSRDIGAKLSLDPRTGVYRGVYTGSSSGPARLVGRLKGDTLDLRVTWNRVIYDDNTARMLIRNHGGKAFIMQVVEKIDGKSVVVSNLSFRR